MSKPVRNAHPASIRAIRRTLFIDVLRSYAAQNKFVAHDFVVMPNHVHVLLTVDQLTSIEKAMGLIKGRFSFRVKRELGYALDIWQLGFTEVRILSRASFLKHRDYIY
jgi:putative transposase